MPVGSYGEETGYWDSFTRGNGGYVPSAQAARNVSAVRRDYPYLSPGATFAVANTGMEVSDLANLELENILRRGDGMPGETVNRRKQRRYDQAARRVTRYRDRIL